MLEQLMQNLISPLDGTSFIKKEGDEIIFSINDKYKVINNIPVMINEKEGIFDINDVLENEETTQSATLNDTKSIKNYIRRRILPSLSRDKYFVKRYNWLSENIKGNILVIGAGEKVQFYKKLFPSSNVITSDVHRQYSPDIIFDAHNIPFKSNTFDLVIAGQVLEHTMKPWIVASEIQRVLKIGGLAHIETPVNFPFHSHPYDFYRFTYTGLRSLFDESSVKKSFVTEGNASTVAVMCSDFTVNLFSNTFLRRVALFISRYVFSWIKYIETDQCDEVKNIRSLAIPKGIGFTFQYDNIKRTPKELLHEYYEIAKRK